MARLPVPGSDDGVWGDVLNQFLTTAHNSDGTIKDAGVVSEKAPLNSPVFTGHVTVPTPTSSTDAATKAYVDKYAVVEIPFIIDGGGSAIATGQKGYLKIPFDCTISQADLYADQTGSIVVDIWKTTYANFPPGSGNSITAAAKPTLSAAQKSQDTSLVGWTTAISAGDVLAYNVNSASTITRVTVTLKAVRA